MSAPTTAHSALWTDIGVNLTSRQFAADRAEVIRRAGNAGVTAMIITGTDAAESHAAAEFARTRPDCLRATAGIHPHCAAAADEPAFALIERLAGQPEVVAIGETGLDFNRDFSPRPVQRKVFERQLELAAAAGKPVFLHERDAFDDQYAILARWRDRLTGGVAHCFTGDRRALAAWLQLDLYIGITGWVCDPRRGGALRELVAEIPGERLLLETDAPYLLPRHVTPSSLSIPQRRRNEPCLLPLIAAEVAAIRGEQPEDLAATVGANVRRLFGMDDLAQPAATRSR